MTTIGDNSAYPASTPSAGVVKQETVVPPKKVKFEKTTKDSSAQA